MPKKEDQMIDTKVTLVSPGGGSLVPFGLAMSSTTPMTRTEERMVQEKRKQLLAMEHQKDKTKHAVRCVGELHQQAAAVFSQDMSHHAGLTDAARGTAYQALVEEFNEYSAKLEAQHLYRIVDTGAYHIGTIVAQSTLMPDVVEPAPPKRTGWAKILGG